MSQSISLYKQLANHKLFNKTINFDLKRIKLVLKKLNHPERKLNNVINFLGSSGKFTTLHSVRCFIEANKQNAFVFWNHPNWSNRATSGITEMNTFHTKNAKNGMLHGIEVANTHSYSEGAFQAALDFNLALIGTSDVHDLIDWDYEPHNGGHRPVTLVFVEEKN